MHASKQASNLLLNEVCKREREKERERERKREKEREKESAHGSKARCPPPSDALPSPSPSELRIPSPQKSVIPPPSLRHLADGPGAIQQPVYIHLAFHDPSRARPRPKSGIVMSSCHPVPPYPPMPGNEQMPIARNTKHSPRRYTSCNPSGCFVSLPCPLSLLVEHLSSDKKDGLFPFPQPNMRNSGHLIRHPRGNVKAPVLLTGKEKPIRLRLSTPPAGRSSATY
ncbi:uncharacterized protein LY79DRAFT_277713 [Colletotrichum navitas]|uniref:Uncharacterized protein n=1 Tax=Colletotrichum navitas TaxID=681940 RepID=A0AAD8V190_9PEZI|nr:uncharacterized protein LY79DRAFT_277713 [Colletotrichum navitas]KAK1585051.1 hypothetical protein LY79DRAFT_277713 [Colletotrichum navitas]